MARIVFSAMSNVTWLETRFVDSFVEGMIRALVRAGNEVLNFRVNDFSFNGKYVGCADKIREKVKAFKPDMILTLNNSLPYPGLIDDTDCPVACLAADSYAFFSNKDLIKQNPDRYYFYNFSNDTIKTLKDWFPEAHQDRNILFGHATDIQAMDVDQDIPVSFVGSIANWNKDLVHHFQRFPHNPDMSYDDQNNAKEYFFDLLEQFKDNPFMSIENDGIPGATHWAMPVETSMIHLLTCRERFRVLSQLTDLGLTVFGYPHAYTDVLIYNPDLFRCFNFEPSVSLGHATSTYNRSRVSLNLPHGHAQEGFSWRVCDILASNSTLLSCRQPDLVRLSKGYMDLPMFESPAEARDLTQSLLNDPAWRQDLSLGSQAMIKDKCRFEPKFAVVEETIPNITLLGDTTGSVEWVDGTQLLDVAKLRNVRIKRYFTNTGHEIVNGQITPYQAVKRTTSKAVRAVGRKVMWKLKGN